MRRITLWAMSTLTALVLLFSYSTSRPTDVTAAAETRQVVSSQQSAVSGAMSGAVSGAASGAASDSSGGSSSSAASSPTSPGTYTGDEVMTRFGVVQVQITVEDGTITSADAVQAPMRDRHDQMINSRAVPVYNSEVVDAQSADIDVVSGATVTWEGYTTSLQSAIDQANL
ncbi:FMN-binding protein [Intrasporangium sp. DVR]|uniref:FMN-binding protein n=1 Tax=Intrasporangium sp. DVR TaxID=3127867 RepID=UPI00313A51E0